MAVKQDNLTIGFDPLAWMDDEAATTESEQAEKNPKPEVVEENKPVITENKKVVEDSSNKAIKIETELQENEANVEQTATAIEDLKIILDATLTIQNVSKLYEKIKIRLESQEQIEFDASSVVSIDTATLQLLIVLKRTAIKLQKEVIIDFPSDNFIEAAELLGVTEMLDVDQATAGFF